MEEPRLSASGGGSDGRARRQGIQQRPDLGWGHLLGRLLFFLVLDVIIGCIFYYVSCGKKCKDNFSGVTGDDFADSLYFSTTTLTTTGFGDIAPTARTSKTFTAIYIACNTFYINYLVYPPFVRLVQLAEGRRLVLALGYCFICFVSGMSLLKGMGGLGWNSAFYTFVVSFSTTGYGDYTFTKMWGRVLNSLWLLVSHLVNYCLGGVVTDAGDDFLSKMDDDARAQAATAAATDLAAIEQERNAAAAQLAGAVQERNAAVVQLAGVVQERNAAVVQLAGVEQERNAAVVQLAGVEQERNAAAAQLAGVQQERNAAAAQLAGVEQERDAALAAQNLAREDLAVAEWERDVAVAAQNLARENLAVAQWERDVAVAAQNLARENLAVAEGERDAAVAAQNLTRENLAVAEWEKDAAVAAQNLARENLAVAQWEKNAAVAAQNLARSDLAVAEWERDAAVAAQDSAREDLAVAEWERDAAVNLLLMGLLNSLLFLLLQRFGL